MWFGGEKEEAGREEDYQKMPFQISSSRIFSFRVKFSPLILGHHQIQYYTKFLKPLTPLRGFSTLCFRRPCYSHKYTNLTPTETINLSTDCRGWHQAPPPPVSATRRRMPPEGASLSSPSSMSSPQSSSASSSSSSNDNTSSPSSRSIPSPGQSRGGGAIRPKNVAYANLPNFCKIRERTVTKTNNLNPNV